MKTTLALISMLFSTMVLACPDISGDYNCQLGSKILSTKIQEIPNGFVINTDGFEAEYITDGKVYDVPATDSMIDAQKRSSCQDDKFIVDFTATLLYEGTAIGKQVSKTTYFLQDNNLKMIKKTKAKGLPLPTQSYNCTRN